MGMIYVDVDVWVWMRIGMRECGGCGPWSGGVCE